MTDDLQAWIRPPSQHALQRRQRRRLRVGVLVMGAFLAGLAYGRFSATPVRLTCYAPDTITRPGPAPLFVCKGESL